MPDSAASGTAASTSQAAAPGFLQRHHFLLRRLHSLSGIVPVGVFVIFHLFTNAQLAVGTFQHEVDFIHSLPALLVLEVSLWGAIGFHAALGLVYTFLGNKPNATRYRYGDNWRYAFQRITGIIALVFIFLHVATLRWGWNIFGWETVFVPDKAVDTTAYALQFAWWVPVIYVIGALSVIYHWANGLWTAAITWGLTLTVQAQKRWGFVCMALGIALTVFFAAAMWGGMTHELPANIEQQMQEAAESHSHSH